MNSTDNVKRMARIGVANVRQEDVQVQPMMPPKSPIFYTPWGNSSSSIYWDIIGRGDFEFN